jgi:hypothetical protein
MSEGTATGKTAAETSTVAGVTEQGSSTSVVGIPLNQRRADLSYARLVSRLRAQDETKLVVINFDVPSVVAQLLATASRVKANRHLFESVRPFDMRMVDDFEDTTLSLAYAHALVRIAEDTIESEDVPYLFEQRSFLIHVGNIAVRAKLLDPAKLKKFDNSADQEELAYDSLSLAELYLRTWDKLAGKVPVTKEQLEAVRDRANSVMLMQSSKGEKQTSVVEAGLDRRRAATKVFHDLRKIQFALGLVLDTQEQMDAIAPPVQARKRRKGAKAGAPSNAEETVPEDASEETDVDEVDGGSDVVNPTPAPRTSVLNFKGETPLKAAVGDGLPGSSPIDDEDK